VGDDSAADMALSSDERIAGSGRQR
jgi:hypothetical protein